MTDASPPVLVPAGAPLIAAATWVGQACWAELRLHAALTAWLGDESEPGRRLAWWTVRAHHAQVADRWHQRLPELREMPRAAFVAPSGTEVERWFEALEGVPAGGPGRVAAVSAPLHALALGYEAHRHVARGPADGPVADSLVLAAARAVADEVAVLNLVDVAVDEPVVPALP